MSERGRDVSGTPRIGSPVGDLAAGQTIILKICQDRLANALVCGVTLLQGTASTGIGPGAAEGAGMQMVVAGAGGALQTGETTINIGATAAGNATIVVK
jgi:hypothetical protein